MPAWLIPALKAVLPHIGTIVAAAAPVFTKKRGEVATSEMTLLQQQITELQVAASANDAHIKELAAQMERTVAALERGAAIVERTQKRMLGLCILAAAVAMVALLIAVFILATR